MPNEENDQFVERRQIAEPAPWTDKIQTVVSLLIVFGAIFSFGITGYTGIKNDLLQIQIDILEYKNSIKVLRQEVNKITPWVSETKTKLIRDHLTTEFNIQQIEKTLNGIHITLVKHREKIDLIFRNSQQVEVRYEKGKYVEK